MQLIAGVDEVGRGPLVGPVFAAAVILNPHHLIPGITDSKKISANKRQAVSIDIKENSIAWAIGRAEVNEIDQINILRASLLAMKRAVQALTVVPDEVWVDGQHLPDLTLPMQAFVKGDLTKDCIGAASIVAKVARDELMETLDLQYPGYGWANNKGYPTKKHLQALIDLGITELHRKSFAPVKRLL